MKKSFKFTAKKVDQAISEGLLQLGVEQHEVEINIISSGGLFKKAEVEIIMEVPDEVVPVKIEPVPMPTATPIAAAPPVEKPVKKEQQPKKEQPKKEKQAQQQQPQAEKPKKLFEKFADDSVAVAPAFATKYANNSGDSGNGNGAKGHKNGGASKKNQSSNQSQEPKTAKPKAVENGENGEIPAPRKRAEVAPATEEHAKRAADFLTGLLALTEFSNEVETSVENGLEVNMKAESAILIGKHGDMLEALQYVTSQVVNKGEEKYIPVGLDVLGYRAKRITTLQNIAQKMADKCVNLNRRIALEPMSSSDRRVVHTYLDTLEGITTRSQGFDPNRRIVIYPAK